MSTLEHNIKADLFLHRGKLPNNFDKTLSENLKPSALAVFQDAYLFDFVSQDDDERKLEGEIIGTCAVWWHLSSSGESLNLNMPGELAKLL